MSQSTRLGLPYLAAGQAQKHVTVTESLLRLDAVVNLAAKSGTTGAQPTSPSDGDIYVLLAGKTGAARAPWRTAPSPIVAMAFGSSSRRTRLALLRRTRARFPAIRRASQISSRRPLDTSHLGHDRSRPHRLIQWPAQRIRQRASWWPIHASDSVQSPISDPNFVFMRETVTGSAMSITHGAFDHRRMGLTLT